MGYMIVRMCRVDNEQLIVIFPDREERFVLLVSSAGRVQVYQITEHAHEQSVIEGLMDYVGMSLGEGATFEMAHAEMGQRMQPVKMTEVDLRSLMVKAMFRFLMQEQK